MRHWSRHQVVQGMGAVGLGLVAGCRAWPWQATPAPRIPRIGFLGTSGPGNPYAEAFVQGLRAYGNEDGQSVTIEWRWSAVPDEYASLAAELVHLPVDVIVAYGTVGVLAARQATDTTPI